jgi:hypothetical protein
MITIFDDLPWHDAVIISLEIDRRRPGHSDEVVLFVEWPDQRRSSIRFSECYAFEGRMNFGIVASEAVKTATESDDTDELRVIKDKWLKIGVNISDLRCFSIETSSTASTINIYARQWIERPES